MIQRVDSRALRRIAALLIAFAAACGEGTDGRGDAGGTVTKGDDIEDSGDVTMPPPDACTAACTVEEMCLGRSRDACLTQCGSDHEFFAGDRTGGCVQDYEALLQCIGALTCEEAAQYDAGYDEMYPCELQEESFVDACLLQGDPAPAVCVRLCNRTAECSLGDISECEASCASQLDFAGRLSEECGTAQSELLDCAAELECAELGGYYDGDENVCGEAFAATEIACAM